MTQVCITGVGAVTPLGHSFSTFADNLLSGKSGVATHRLLGNDASAPQIAAAVDEIPSPPQWDRGAFGRLNRMEQLALSCTGLALDDAGLQDRRDKLRIGLVLGMGGEHMHIWELDRLQGGNRVEEPGRDTQSVVYSVTSALGLRGPGLAVAAACASGAIALALGRRWVQTGMVDVCLAGGCDLITPLCYAAFYNLRALSRREGAAESASRPFDRDRDGFVMGEGGTVLALEPVGAARRRRAKIYGNLAGFGAASDASHMVIPSSDPQHAAKAMRMAMDDARVTPDDVDYVNAHATSTTVGDRAETAALQLALGPAVDSVPVSATKSMTGHLLSAAAAVEALACLVALHYQAVPPTINLDHPDPECRLRHVPHKAESRPVRVAFSNSFGFGGANTCLVLTKAA